MDNNDNKKITPDEDALDCAGKWYNLIHSDLSHDEIMKIVKEDMDRLLNFK